MLSVRIFVVAMLLVPHPEPAAAAQPTAGTKLRLRAGPEFSVPKMVFRSVDDSIEPPESPMVDLPTFSLTEIHCGAERCDAGTGTGRITLPVERWRRRGEEGDKRFRYFDRDRSHAGVKSARYEPGRIVVRATGNGWSWAPDSVETVLAEFSVGEKRYCSVFGGTERRNEGGRIWLKNAPAPSACPVVCGDHRREDGEDCDVLDDHACPGLCRDDCTCPAPVCGNGVIEAGESCEDGVGGCSGGRECASDCGCCSRMYQSCSDDLPCCSDQAYCTPPRGGSSIRRCRPVAGLGEDCGAGFEDPCHSDLACVGEYSLPGVGIAGRCYDDVCTRDSDCASGEECVNQFPGLGPGLCAPVACSSAADCLGNETCEDGTCCGGPGALCDLIGAPFPWRNCCSAGTTCLNVGAFPTCVPD